MENPSTWTPIEHTIHEAMVKADMDFVKNIIGKSVVRYISDALKEKGYLKEI